MRVSAVSELMLMDSVSPRPPGHVQAKGLSDISAQNEGLWLSFPDIEKLLKIGPATMHAGRTWLLCPPRRTDLWDGRARDMVMYRATERDMQTQG